MRQCFRALSAHRVPAMRDARKAQEAAGTAPRTPPRAFLVLTPLSSALWSLHSLISYARSLRLRVQKCGFQSKGHLENSYTKGCNLKFQSSTENSGKLRKGILLPTHPQMPSPSSSLEPPHFAMTLRSWQQDLVVDVSETHLLTLRIRKDRNQACLVYSQDQGPCLTHSWSSVHVSGERAEGRNLWPQRCA